MKDGNDTHSADSASETPAMEIITGVSPASGHKSPVAKLIRFAVYGMVAMVATTLITISLVPETSEYLTFVPEPPLPELDPDFLAEVIAQQEAYLQSECVTGIPHTPKLDAMATSEGISVALINVDGEGPAVAIGRTLESPQPSNAPDDAAPADSTATDDASSPAN